MKHVFFERKTIAFAPNNLAPTDIELPWFPALAVTKVTPLNVYGSESRAQEDFKSGLKLTVAQKMSELRQFQFSKISTKNRRFSRNSAAFNVLTDPSL